MITRSPDPTILYEDTHVIVLSKPPGLLSQGDHSGDLSLVDLMRKHVGRPYVGLVHRLDRNTSGLMVLGKRTKSADRLTQAMQAGNLCRHYLGWVRGTFRNREERWENRLLKDENTNTVREDPRGRRCALRATGLNTMTFRGVGPLTLVKFELETGMSHQIRVQASLRKLPLVGDPKYGGPRYPRVALHSAYLAFPHPMGDQTMEFCFGLPDELKESAILSFRFDAP